MKIQLNQINQKRHMKNLALVVNKECDYLKHHLNQSKQSFPVATTIAELGLSTRADNCLAKVKYNHDLSLEELRKMSPCDMVGIKNAGLTTVAEIVYSLYKRAGIDISTNERKFDENGYPVFGTRNGYDINGWYASLYTLEKLMNLIIPIIHKRFDEDYKPKFLQEV